MATIKEIQNDIWHALTRAATSLKILSKIDAIVRESGSDLTLLNQYKDFFVPTAGAHELQCVVRLAALYDTGDTYASMWTFCSKVEKGGLLSYHTNQLTLEEIRNKLCGLRKLSRKVYDARNRFYAHRSLDRFNPAARSVSVSMDDLKLLLDGTQESFNELSGYVGGESYVHLECTDLHFEEILACLRNAECNGTPAHN